MSKLDWGGVLMDAISLTTTINTLASIIADSVDDEDDIALLAAIFTQLGDTLATILAYRVIGDESK